MAIITPPSRHSSPQSEEAEYSDNHDHETDYVNDVVHTEISLLWRNASQTGIETRERAYRCFNNRCQTWKLSPQPQRPFSFGLVKVKPAVWFFTS
jgi:hypothetical protein